MPKLSIEFITYFAIILHESSFSHLPNLTLTLKLSLKVNLVPYQKSWDTKPINCVGVRTFGIEIRKCSNVEISHSFMLHFIVPMFSLKPKTFFTIL